MDNKDRTLQFRYYLSPYYWPLWFAIFILWLTSFFPAFLINLIGTGLGKLIFYCVPSRRRIAKINLQQAYPNKDSEEILKLNKNAFKSLGISIFEMGIAWFRNENHLKGLYHIEGKEHLENAINSKRGIILLTGHFTTLELGGHLISLNTPQFDAVYKKARNPLFNALMVHNRSKFIDRLLDHKKPRGAIRSLKEKRIIWFAPDQDFSDQDIVFTPFLGGIASTLTATTKLAKMCDAIVLPFYPVRLDNNQGYKIIVLPELTNFPSGDMKSDSALVNKTIENMVYTHPEQYLWSHKRFKTHAEGHTNIYQKNKDA